MNQTTDRARALLVCLCLATLAGATMSAPSSVLAQSDGEAGASDKSASAASGPRFSKEFAPRGAQKGGAQKKVELRIEPSVADNDWSVHVVSADKRERSLLREQLPRWATAEHYGFEVSTEDLGGGISAVILDVLPDVHGDGPPSATQYQVVWLVTERRGRLKWRRLETAQYSALDGGEHFEFRKDGKTHRLVRRRRGNESIFCGDSPDNPIIFDQYDAKKDRFDQRLDIERLLDGAPTLTARNSREDFNPPALQSWYQWFAASSDRRSPDRRGALIRPLELGDHEFDTGWMEGVEGLGRGEFVSAQINDAAALSSLRILPGIGSNERAFEAFAKPTRLLVGLSDGSRYVVELGKADFEQVNSGDGVFVELPEPKKTRCMSVMLLESEAGKRVKNQPDWMRTTTLIAEITPFSQLHGPDAQTTARRFVEAISNEKDGRARQRMAELPLSLERELVDEVRRALEQGSAEKRQRIIPLMASLPADEAVPMLIRFLRETDPSAPEYRAIKRSLAAHYSAAAPALVEFLGEDKPDETKHTDVLRLLGRVGKATHLTMLVDQLGQGERNVRNERVRAIGAGGQPLVAPLLMHARKHTDTEAGYDALRALNLLGKRLHYNSHGVLPSPEVYSALLAEITERRALLRALEVAKFFNADGFVKTARDKYSVHRDPLVRSATVTALERYPSDEARDVLVRALSDSSPDVRIAAISAIAEREDAAQALEALLAYSRAETWKLGLRQAFGVLASIENEATSDAFATRLREEPNTEPSLWAAQALDRARRPIDADLAQSLIERSDVRLEMRLALIDLLGLDDSDGGERYLLDLLDKKRWSEFSEETRARNQLRDRVILSLGRRRSQAAMPRLLAIAKNAEAFDVRQVALRSLAFYRDEKLLSELRSWQDSVDPKLERFLDDTITMIDRRRSLSGVKSDIDEVLEIDEKSESNNPDGASNKPSTEED